MTLPEQQVPATGRLDYTRPVVPAVMTEGRWMKATAFRISDRQVVHHILTSIVPGAPQPGAAAPGNSNAGVSIGGYGPGRLANMNPKDMGVWIPPSGGVSFQNHYTPYGKATTERTQMGIYFYPKDQQPLYPMRTFGIFDFGITIQTMTNSNPELAKQIADDIAEFTWRKREDLVKAAKIYPMPDGVALAKKTCEAGKTPVVLADHSDRSGAGTWLLEQVIAQGLSKTLIATLADEEACAKLASVKVGDAVDMAVGGKLDVSAGAPVPIKGKVRYILDTQGRRNGPGQRWVAVEIERGNVVVLSPYLVQIMEVDTLREAGLEPDSFDVIAIKSRAHFRRGFDDNGWAKTILLVEPLEPFLGTIRLEALPYEHADLKRFYPYGNPTFP